MAATDDLAAVEGEDALLLAQATALALHCNDAAGWYELERLRAGYYAAAAADAAAEEHQHHQAQQQQQHQEQQQQQQQESRIQYLAFPQQAAGVMHGRVPARKRGFCEALSAQAELDAETEREAASVEARYAAKPRRCFHEAGSPSTHCAAAYCTAASASA